MPCLLMIHLLIQQINQGTVPDADSAEGRNSDPMLELEIQLSSLDSEIKNLDEISADSQIS